MARTGRARRRCGNEEAAVAVDSRPRGTGSCIHSPWARPAGTAGWDSDCTVSSAPYPVAFPAALPADDDRSSCRLGMLLQTDRVLRRVGTARLCDARWRCDCRRRGL
jgi:hypothetical protein